MGNRDKLRKTSFSQVLYVAVFILDNAKYVLEAMLAAIALLLTMLFTDAFMATCGSWCPLRVQALCGLKPFDKQHTPLTCHQWVMGNGLIVLWSQSSLSNNLPCMRASPFFLRNVSYLKQILLLVSWQATYKVNLSRLDFAIIG